MTDPAAAQIRSYVDRVMRLKEEIAALNADVSEVYKEAVGNGFDKKALQATVKRAALPREDLQEQDEMRDLYWRAYTGTEVALTRARAPDPAPPPHDPHTGEVIDLAPETSAAIPGVPEGEPSTPSPDDALPADEARTPSSQSGQALNSSPVRPRVVAGPMETPDIPAFLDRLRARAIPNEAAE